MVVKGKLAVKNIKNEIGTKIWQREGDRLNEFKVEVDKELGNEIFGYKISPNDQFETQYKTECHAKLHINQRIVQICSKFLKSNAAIIAILTSIILKLYLQV